MLSWLKRQQEGEFLQSSPIHDFNTGGLACILYTRRLKVQAVKIHLLPCDWLETQEVSLQMYS